MICNCNNTHRVVTVTATTTEVVLTVTDPNNIGNLERFNLICCKPISSVVDSAPVPVFITANGANVPVKNSLGLPLMSNLVPYGKTCGRYVIDNSGTAPETYIILKTPCYA